MPWALASLSVATAGILSLMPLFWTLPGRLLAGPAAAGGLALINSVGSLSGMLGVSVIGHVGTEVGMLLFAGMLLLCAVLLYWAFPARAIAGPSLQAAVAEL